MQPDQHEAPVSSPFATRFLRMSPNRAIDPEQVRLGFRLLVSVLMQLPDPGDVCFEYEASDAESLSWTIRLDCMTESGADHNQTTAVTLVAAIAPWLDVRAGAAQDAPIEELPTVRFALGTEQVLTATATASFMWTAVAQGRTPIRFALHIQELIPPDGESAEAQVRAEAVLSAPTEHIDALAALAGLDAGHRAALRVVAPRREAIQGELLTDIPTIARILAGPFTVPSLRSRPQPIAVTEMGDLLDSAVPPHMAIIGGSGQGKTTTLNHAISEAYRRGSTVVVFCPHGDLAVRAAATAVRHDIEPIVYDLGAVDGHLHWNLTAPDEGTSPAEWSRRFAEVIRRQVWDTMPDEFFGPVATRALPAIIQMLAADPAGPWPLTRAPELLDIHDSSFRDAVLTRIGDQGLTRLMQQEVMPMLTARDAGNASLWLISKFDPLIGDATVRRIIETHRRDVTMQPAVRGRSVIVSAPHTRLTEAGATVLTALLLEQLWSAARSVPQSEHPLEIFIDEWHKLPSPSIPEMLAEGRKFGVRLRLANQHFAQLTSAQREAVLANTGLIGTFRTSPADASLLDLRFPTVTRHRMETLPRHTLAYSTGDTDAVVLTPAPTACDPSIFHRIAARLLSSVDGPDERHDVDDSESGTGPVNAETWLRDILGAEPA